MDETTIPCPHCGKMTIRIREIPGTILIKRGFTGKKGPQFFPGRDFILTPDCEECGKNYKEPEHIDYDRRIEDFKKAGLPLIITG